MTPTTQSGYHEIQGYRVSVICDMREVDDASIQTEMPTAEAIAKALAPLFPPFCRVLASNDGLTDYDIEGGQA